MASSSTDLGQIVSCSDDNTVRIWRLHDQTSLCKEGFKCGSASRLANHAPVLMTSLNLHDREDSSVTPVRPANRFVCLFVCLGFCLFVCLGFCLFVCFGFCLYFCLFVSYICCLFVNYIFFIFG